MQIIHGQEKYVLVFEWLVPFNFCIWSQVICWKISQALILMLCKYISSLKQLARVAPTFPDTSCQDFLLHESFCSVFFLASSSLGCPRTFLAIWIYAHFHESTKAGLYIHECAAQQTQHLSRYQREYWSLLHTSPISGCLPTANSVPGISPSMW